MTCSFAKVCLACSSLSFQDGVMLHCRRLPPAPWQTRQSRQRQEGRCTVEIWRKCGPKPSKIVVQVVMTCSFAKVCLACSSLSFQDGVMLHCRRLLPALWQTRQSRQRQEGRYTVEIWRKCGPKPSKIVVVMTCSYAKVCFACSSLSLQDGVCQTYKGHLFQFHCKSRRLRLVLWEQKRSRPRQDGEEG